MGMPWVGCMIRPMVQLFMMTVPTSPSDDGSIWSMRPYRFLYLEDQRLRHLVSDLLVELVFT